MYYLKLSVIRLSSIQLNFLFVAAKQQDKTIKSVPFRWREVWLPLILELELS